MSSNTVATKNSSEQNFSCNFRNEPEISSLLLQSSSLSIQLLLHDLGKQTDRNFETIPNNAVDHFTQYSSTY